ncbi:MAG: hypothetical protein AB7T22_14960, partial [Calditrichaceae bacterium]
MNIRSVILILLSFSLSYSTESGWFEVSGQYATVEYTPENEIIADSLLLMADKAIPGLCALHGLPLSSFDRKKARIILTDAPDFSNGYAVGKDVVIFATSSMYIQTWTGSDLWYGQVLKHELAHHIT